MPLPPPPVPLRFTPKENSFNTSAGDGRMATNTAITPPRFQVLHGTPKDGPNYNSVPSKAATLLQAQPQFAKVTPTAPGAAASTLTTEEGTATSTTTAAATKTPLESRNNSNGIALQPAGFNPLPFPFPRSPPTVQTSPSSSYSISSQQLLQLRQLVQDLTSENAVLQQRMRVLMEGETHDDVNLPGLTIFSAPGSVSSTANASITSSGCSPAEAEALLLRIRRLEAALKVEAMEREALEVRLQAQERVLARLIMQ